LRVHTMEFTSAERPPSLKDPRNVASSSCRPLRPHAACTRLEKGLAHGFVNSSDGFVNDSGGFVNDSGGLVNDSGAEERAALVPPLHLRGAGGVEDSAFERGEERGRKLSKSRFRVTKTDEASIGTVAVQEAEADLKSLTQQLQRLLQLSPQCLHEVSTEDALRVLIAARDQLKKQNTDLWQHNELLEESLSGQSSLPSF